ncbi:MAG: methyltransferase [Bryobacterales bacterium]|nr:methyltransferase [Bryobacterales bacterium]
MASTFPLRMGTPEQHRAVREFLRTARFSEPELLQAFEIEDLHTLLTAAGDERARLRRRIDQGGAQMLLAKLFLGGFAVRWQDAAGLIPASIFEMLKGLGLLDDSGRCPVLFYPAGDFWIASDRPASTDGYGYGGPDFVMSALEHLSRTYVGSIGKERCGRFLEVGAGAGLGALCATHFADEVWATDITERSVACMEFNRALNGVSEEKMRIGCGDMYAPAVGLQFDRIACNPPFEPPLRHELIYSVGGLDGEQLIERALREGVGLLRPGGRIYCQALGTDREGESFFGRVCRWLEGTETGVAYFVRTRLSTDSYTAGQLMNSGADADTVARWDEFYEKLQAKAVSLGHLIVERGACFRFEENIVDATEWGEMDRRIEWDQSRRGAEWRSRALEGRWATSENCAFEAMYRMRDGKLRAESHILSCAAPMEGKFEAAEVVREILKEAAGGATGGAIVERLGAAFPADAVLEGMALCIGVGALQERCEA